jgi:hypothetical protein
VFRIPQGFYDKDRIPNSYWIEFFDIDTDILRSNLASDSYERYYFASPSTQPQYNTKNRLIAKQSQTATVTIATPGVVTLTSHGMSVGDPFYWTTAGALPTGIVANQWYFVSAVVDANTFRFAATPGGSDVATSGTQSGVHTIYLNQPLLLGVPAPSIAPTVSNTGGSGTVESRAYIYTWVTEYGEEGAPSNPSTVSSGFPNATWTIGVSNPTNSEAAQRKIKFVNIYRTVTASTGTTTYFFVAQIAVGTTSYADSTVNVSSNNQLQSLYWSTPPSDLKGFVNMPNGMVAGFRSNEVWFCEPYRMHAWPVAYTVSVDYPIIGLGVVGQTVIVCTAVSPYAISGVSPGSTSMSRISVTEPCMSRGSIISTASGVTYAAPEGLVLVTPGGATNLTRDLITKDKWGAYLPLPNLRAATLNDAYYCWGSQQGITFQQDAFQNDSFQAGDVSGGYEGAHIDFQNSRVAYNTLATDTFAVNTWNDVWTGEVFVLKSGQLYWMDTSESRPHGSFVWRSKIFSLPNRRNIEAMRVWFEEFPDSPTLNPVRNTGLVQTLAADQWGLVRVYADGNLVMTRELRTDGEFMRLPSGFKASTYQVEIEARVKIISVEMATSAKELLNV